MPNMDISAEIQAIRDAFEGREVRTSIVDALEAVQTEVNHLAPATFISGTETVTLTEGAFYISAELSLPFTPTSRTRILATYKESTRRASDTDCACLKLYYSDSKITALVLNPLSSQLGFDSFPAGTYYIDWLVLEQGV